MTCATYSIYVKAAVCTAYRWLFLLRGMYFWKPKGLEWLELLTPITTWWSFQLPSIELAPWIYSSNQFPSHFYSMLAQVRGHTRRWVLSLSSATPGALFGATSPSHTCCLVLPPPLTTYMCRPCMYMSLMMWRWGGGGLVPCRLSER